MKQSKLLTEARAEKDLTQESPVFAPHDDDGLRGHNNIQDMAPRSSLLKLAPRGIVSNRVASDDGLRGHNNIQDTAPRSSLLKLAPRYRI